MRALTQPGTLRLAMPAALGSALLALPRILSWDRRTYPVWYLEAVLFLTGTVLWAFVFAWHNKYSSRPLFLARIGRRCLAEATIAGLACAILLREFIDPSLRLLVPQDYPSSVGELGAMVLFGLGFGQLFTLFAPFAWLLRLFQSQRAAAVLTVLFGLFLMAIKRQMAPEALPGGLLLWLATFTAVSGSFSVYFYLRGGVLLASWFGLVMSARHLFLLLFTAVQQD